MKEDIVVEYKGRRISIALELAKDATFDLRGFALRKFGLLPPAPPPSPEVIKALNDEIEDALKEEEGRPESA